MNPPDSGYAELFDRHIREVFKDALRSTLRHPSLAGFFARTGTAQRRAARRRQERQRHGIAVPPLLIASITHECNLHCTNCYARSHRRPSAEEMPLARWREVIAEARDLGISLVMIAGGEPLTRPEILDLTRGFPDLIFPLFTNGLLLDAARVAELRRQRHVIPVVSLEGFEPETDARRGEGVYDRARGVIAQLAGSDIFFGASLTVTRLNFAVLTGASFARSLADAGCRLFIFVEFTPVDESTAAFALTPEQSRELEMRRQALRRELGGVVISFPGDEEQYGGCLAAGRGFVHIGPDGSLEPCPFAPFSDISVRERPLEQALASHLLARIRAGHARLTETAGGCALWANREWVRGMLAEEKSE